MNIEKSTWACRKRLLSFFIMATAVLTASSQTYPPKDSPQLEFALQLRVHISEPYTIGETAHGRRIVIPITGGSFEGPSLKGTILSGGADYQLANADGTRTELEAIYSIRRMMASISMSVTGDWYVTVRTLTELPIIISKPPPSLRHPRTAAMHG